MILCGRRKLGGQRRYSTNQIFEVAQVGSPPEIYLLMVPVTQPGFRRTELPILTQVQPVTIDTEIAFETAKAENQIIAYILFYWWH